MDQHNLAQHDSNLLLPGGSILLFMYHLCQHCANFRLFFINNRLLAQARIRQCTHLNQLSHKPTIKNIMLDFID